MRAPALHPADESRGEAALRLWAADLLSVRDRLERRIHEEIELAAREDGLVDAEQLRRGLLKVVEEEGWDPTPDGRPGGGHP